MIVNGTAPGRHHRRLPDGRQNPSAALQAVQDLSPAWKPSPASSPWAADDEQRAAWPRDAYIDMHAYARILRNELHNISLAEEIEERAERAPLKCDREPARQPHQ